MISENGVGLHRPRNVDWKRAAAILYGDWGTSKAYVIGLAFVAADFSSLPIIIAVCALTAVVAYNYIIICKHFPDGGGVYSAARDQSRILAVIGALLLVANMTVTAALSGWASLSYFGVPKELIAQSAMVLILCVGMVNLFGPRHTGSMAMALAVPAVVAVLLIVGMSLPHLTTAHLEPSHQGALKNWVSFVGVILALSGVEAIANLTGVMKLDPDASPDKPRVLHTARRAIWLVALEVVLGTAALGWVMLSLPKDLTPQLLDHKEDMLRFLGEQYGGRLLGPTFGQFFSILIGIVFGLLLISAVNTAIVALIGLIYMMARDGEMPGPLTRLNRNGVPHGPLLIAVLLPVMVLVFVRHFEVLAALYAIGVVGAIAVNVGSCSFNMKLSLRWYERGIMAATFAVLLAVELTIAKTQQDALFFAVCVLGVGLGLRAYAQKRAGLTTVIVAREVAAGMSPEALKDLRPRTGAVQKMMVAARGVTPVLRFALEEARMRQASLYILFVKELAVSLPGALSEPVRPRWQDDPQAAAIMYAMLDLGKTHNVPVVPLFAVSEDPAAIIVDLSATLGVDMLILGASRRRFFAQLLKGDVIASIARGLPENIELLIQG